MPQAFISYVRNDEDAARRLGNELERRGLHTSWLDRLVAPGESWIASLEKAISRSDVIFVLVSPESERSQWLASETALALAQAEQGRARVVPVLLDRNVRLPFLLERIQGIEFYDPDRSQRQLDALVQSLQASATQDMDRSARDLTAELAYVKSGRNALAHEIAVHAYTHTVWSSIIATTAVALASMSGLFAAILSLYFIQPAPLRGWALPFALGVFASLACFLLSTVLWHRLIRRARQQESD
ncbi:MAG: toll/interleukin-1 receptor domain-containing protein [Deltaproteobacteria bacterium]|nr:toll/interleukin-1 receptor domain-containing protein [Deltaproteobacteria bacterium]